MPAEDHPTFPRKRRSSYPKLSAAVAAVVLTAGLLTGVTAPAQAIFNGTPTDPTAFQFTARVVSYFPDKSTRTCTGSLFNSEAVVTAAHCVQDYLGNKANLSQATFFYGIPGKQFSEIVMTILPHENYDFPTHTNDIAILFLAEHVTTVQPIKLDRAAPPLGAQIVHAGYGCTEDPIAQPKKCTRPTQLRGMSDRIVSGSMCPGIALTEICSASNESITNEGDSGGPVIWLDNGVRKLVGVNHGWESKSYANPKYRTVSTSVMRELAWIDRMAG